MSIKNWGCKLPQGLYRFLVRRYVCESVRRAVRLLSETIRPILRRTIPKIRPKNVQYLELCDGQSASVSTTLANTYLNSLLFYMYEPI